MTTPGGKPASSAMRAISNAPTGVDSAGFRITAHPAASAGASFRLARNMGAFQAVIAPTTPTGTRVVKTCMDGSIGMVAPCSLSARAAYHHQVCGCRAKSGRVSRIGRPVSRVSMTASSSARRV